MGEIPLLEAKVASAIPGELVGDGLEVVGEIPVLPDASGPFATAVLLVDSDGTPGSGEPSLEWSAGVVSSPVTIGGEDGEGTNSVILDSPGESISSYSNPCGFVTGNDGEECKHENS